MLYILSYLQCYDGIGVINFLARVSVSSVVARGETRFTGIVEHFLKILESSLQHENN